jgi:hypothetical protein
MIKLLLFKYKLKKPIILVIFTNMYINYFNFPTQLKNKNKIKLAKFVNSSLSNSAHDSYSYPTPMNSDNSSLQLNP